MSDDKETARAWGWFLIALPAIIGWIAYGGAWLLQPRMGIGFPMPIEAAGYAVGAYYMIVLTLAGARFGPF
jgi:hypothetical protein